ncbi:MAG: hypothetical protein H0T62_05895 [Parachlamydiaceae bacterium]|nr:hypothetical protein [Parachlamydiaceae bacterium]
MNNTLSDTTLLAYNSEGLIPGPDEDEEAFLKRAQECLGLKSLLKNDENHLLPFKVELFQKPLEEACAITTPLLGVCPVWLPLFFSNYQLTPWHGGCAWIFQLQDVGPRLAFLQLRKRFATQTSYLKIYKRDELIAHEVAHVGRMMFDENSYEEILAYRTSSSSWSRWIGPLVQSAFEAGLFILAIMLILLLDLYFLMTENHEAYFSMMPLKLIPAGLLILAVGRLWYRQHTFKKALSNLQQTLGGLETANHMIYRLTDKEINLFASSSSDGILEYAQAQKTKSLRWRLIALAYFSDYFSPII